jgi:hypothetical protein
MGRRYKQLFPVNEKYADDDPNPPPPDPHDQDTGPPDDTDTDDRNPPDEWPPPSAPPDPDPSGRPGGAGGVAAKESPVTFRLLHVDPVTGWLMPSPEVRVDFGNGRDYLTGLARTFVLDRFRTCVFPNCAMPARCCDADHWKPRAQGGATDASTNQGPGCPHHNRITRNRPGWTIEPNGDGTATLITPQGRRYPITPPNYLD